MQISHLWRYLAGAATAALILTGAGLAAFAADAVFPPGSRLGLIPPAGFSVSSGFRGFEDREHKALILVFELPAAAYAEIEKSGSLQSVQKQGLAIEKREEFAIRDGKALLFTGTEESGGIKSRKWLLFASVADLTAAINVQVPEEAKDAYPDAAIRTALATLAARAAPLQEQVELLPFKVGELSGFKVGEVLDNRTIILADNPAQIDLVTAPQMVIGAAPAGPVAPGERDNFSRQALAGLGAFKDMRVTFAEPIRLGNQQGYELRVDAKQAKSGADVAIVQWIRFGNGGVLRVVGVTPKAAWGEAFPRFRAVRDGVGTR